MSPLLIKTRVKGGVKFSEGDSRGSQKVKEKNGLSLKW